MECPFFKKCGGCRFINLTYEEQLKKKQQIVNRALKETADSQGVKIEDIIGSEMPLHYRNKVHSVFALNGNHKAVRGIYREDSHKVVDVKGCLLEDEKADEIIEEIKRLLPSFKYKVYDEDSGTGWLRHVLVRVGADRRERLDDDRASGKQLCFAAHSDREKNTVRNYMVVLVTASVPFPGKNNFIKALRTKFPEITTIVQNINSKRTSMVLGDRNIVCFGSGSITDELMGLRFRISPDSFYQVNPVQTEKLYSKVIELAAPTEQDTVIDAYCGTGTIGSCLAGYSYEVIGLELNPNAVKDAIFNAKQNNIKNIRFINEDATKWMKGYLSKYRDKENNDSGDKDKTDPVGIETKNAVGIKTEKDKKSPDILIMDPPRSGSTPEFINAVSELNISRIIYVSCNPETLSRDLKLFIKKGYKLKKIVPFDMFPWTEHVETVALLSKLSEAKHHIEVKVDMDELDLTSAEAKATYKEIQDWVQEKYGFHVTNLNIAQVKQKLGIIEREKYNKPKSPDSKQPGCPEEKVKIIEDALRHFCKVYMR